MPSPLPQPLFDTLIPFDPNVDPEHSTFVPDEIPVDMDQFQTVRLTESLTDVDALLNHMEFDELIGTKSFDPSAYDYPSIQDDVDELDILFMPSVGSRVNLTYKPFQRVHYPKLDPKDSGSIPGVQTTKDCEENIAVHHSNGQGSLQTSHGEACPFQASLFWCHQTPGSGVHRSQVCQLQEHQ